MFDNIAGKIKGLAVFITWVGIIGSIISGLAYIFTVPAYAFVGLIIMIVGSISSWIGSFTLYGFGQLIENTAKPDVHVPQEPPQKHIICAKCGSLQDSKALFCSMCGQKLYPNEEIHSLQFYLEQGLITAEEYEIRKKELLG